MGPWRWYACMEGEHDGYGFESETREACIEAALRDLGPVVIEITEARFSSATRYEGADFVPFVRQRNQERIDLRMHDATTLTKAEAS